MRDECETVIVCVRTCERERCVCVDVCDRARERERDKVRKSANVGVRVCGWEGGM